MTHTEEILNYFKMDKNYVSHISSTEDSLKEKAYWLEQPETERILAVEFLRAQWIGMNNLSEKMDRSFFDYK